VRALHILRASYATSYSEHGVILLAPPANFRGLARGVSAMPAESQT